MTSQPLELEGTWEEIMAHAAELAGRRVRVTVLPAQPQVALEEPVLDARNQRMLELLTEWEQTPLTEEERDILDGLEQYLEEHPFSLSHAERRHAGGAVLRQPGS
jgi:hypothetical protein